MRVPDRLTAFLERPDRTPMLVVGFCVTLTIAATAVSFPATFRDVNAQARSNAALDYLDLEIGAGNSVLPDQSIAIEARGRIPENGSFAVSVGDRREGWSELAVQHVIEPYMRYFLLPRRLRADAPWVVCVGCDRAAYPGAQPVWEGEDDLAILRRPA